METTVEEGGWIVGRIGDWSEFELRLVDLLEGDINNDLLFWERAYVLMFS